MATATAEAKKGFINTTVGKKYVMGLTGLVWVGFVLVHMLGNLLIFVSPEAYNSYGHALVTNKITFALEAMLVLALVSHIFLALSLTLENRAARGAQRYAKLPNGSKGVSKASQFMAVHGSIILVFVISHLITFKWGNYYEVTYSSGVVMRDLHRLILEVFKQPGAVAWYVVALVFLGFHISHGFGSVFQSLGLKNDKFAGKINKISIIYSIIVAAGFLSQPIYVFLVAK